MAKRLHTQTVQNTIVVDDILEDDVEISMRVSDDDPVIVASPTNPIAKLSHPQLSDLDVPTNRDAMTMSEVDRHRWIEVISTLIQRGTHGYAHIAGITGLSPTFTRTLVLELKEIWAKSLPPSVVNQRREQLYLEAERIKDYCFEGIAMSDNHGVRIKYMQLVLSAGQRQAALIGAEKVRVEVETETNLTIKSPAEREQELLSSLNISQDDLQLLGDALSKELSRKAK